MRVFLATLLWILPAIVQPAHAQDIPAIGSRDRSFFANPHYESLVDYALESRASDFPFKMLRRFYIETSQYEPRGEEIARQLVTYAYRIQTGDPAKIDEDLQAYNDLVKQHLANIGAVTQALSLSRQDARLGDPAFFEWARDGLLRDLMASGDGTSERRAYDIVTLDEQEYLLDELGLNLISTETLDAGFKRLHLHEVEDPLTGERTAIFVDASFPLNKLEEKARQKSFTVDLRRQ